MIELFFGLKRHYVLQSVILLNFKDQLICQLTQACGAF